MRSSNDTAYKKTAGSFYPAEFAFNNSKDLSAAFSVTPDNYPRNGIKWKSPKLNENNLTVDVSLYDYFYIDAKANDYSIVGLDNDGSIGEKVKADSITPSKIIGKGGEVEFRFNNLTVVKTYKRIVLRYKDKTLIKIR